MKISVIIPTFNEKDNISSVISLLDQTLKEIDYEIIIVDDSTDETPQILQQISTQNSSVRYEHRTNERGLGSAVLRGFALAKGDVLAVMDADLQHPPSMLLSMLENIQAGADIVIPSRFVTDGSDGGLSPMRKLISSGARQIARIALHRVRKTTDPTSGFFMFRPQVIENVELRPIGWKILIEILARGNYASIVELPYSFQCRNAGESKMSIKEQWNYIKHIMLLVKDSPMDRRVILFSGVGLLGVLVNMIVYIVFVKMGLNITFSGVISAFVALISNFTLNDRFTWSDSSKDRWLIRASKYFLTSMIGIGIDVSVLTFLYQRVHVHYIFANLSGIVVATVWNYLISNYWTWRSAKSPAVITVSDSISKLH